MPDARSIVLRFNDCINRQDIAGLTALMGSEHALIDRDGGVIAGKDRVSETWGQFFQLFPDYRNTFLRVERSGARIVMSGYATWTHGGPPDHVIWSARVENDLVCEWQVHRDTPENRRELLGNIPVQS